MTGASAMTVTSQEERLRTPLRFPAGIVGFPTAQEYTLVGSEGGLFYLDADSPQEPSFVVVSAAVFFPDYQPILDDATVERLELRGAEEAEVFLLVTVGVDLTDASANQFAPIVVNSRTGTAAQVVLNGQPYPLRAPLLAGRPH